MSSKALTIAEILRLGILDESEDENEILLEAPEEELNLNASDSEDEIISESTEVEDEIEGSDNENEIPGPASNFIGRDGSIWNKVAFVQSRTGSHNIIGGAVDKVILPPGYTVETPVDCFKLFKDEMYAFLGLLIIAGHLKWNAKEYRSFWDPLYGSPIFKASMGLTRFEQIKSFLRFDDKSTRSERRKADKLSPIRDVWETVNKNLGKHYIPSENLTVDEQLMPCRARCSFIQYMPSKPDKYGIKIWWICDSKTAYPLMGIPYTGKEGNTRAVGLAQNIVQRLCTPYFRTNRNITMDNYFTSIELAESLLSNGLTLVGTLRKNKSCIPIEFLPNKNREEGSTLFGFKKKITIVSHVPKPRKAVLFLSTMHHNADIIVDNNKKPISAINKYYNETKSGVDTLDQMVHEYMIKRKTNRWPFSFFMNLLDVSNIAAYIIWGKQFPSWNSKKTNKRNLFLRELGEELTIPLIKKRANNSKLQIASRQAMSKVLRHVQGTDNEVLEPSCSNETAKRRRCHICPYSKSRMQKQFCGTCKKSVCNQHSTTIRKCLVCSDK